MKNKALDKFAHEATSDDEQEKWEKKLLGNDQKHVKQSDFYKAPSNLRG